jgi:hypothetical protein
MQKEIEYCSCCGGKLTGRYERVSKGLALSLLKFREQILSQSELAGKLVNKVHLSKDLKLSKNEYNNFQKLRYHGLIAHYKNKETKEYETGYWLLTSRGNLFCKNELAVPKKLLIFRNKIEERSEEKITLENVLKNDDIPVWYKREDFREDFSVPFENVNDYEEDTDDNQLSMF